MKTHLGVKGKALALLSMAGVGLNELVVKEDGWLGSLVEEQMGILEVWDFK